MVRDPAVLNSASCQQAYIASLRVAMGGSQLTGRGLQFTISPSSSNRTVCAAPSLCWHLCPGSACSCWSPIHRQAGRGHTCVTPLQVPPSSHLLGSGSSLRAGSISASLGACTALLSLIPRTADARQAMQISLQKATEVTTQCPQALDMTAQAILTALWPPAAAEPQSGWRPRAPPGWRAPG